MDRPEGTINRSKESEAIIDRFKDEFQRAQQSEGVPYSIKNFDETPRTQDFVKMAQEMMDLSDIAPANLAETILPQKLLEDRLKMIDEESRLKIHFPEGYKVQIGIVPFTYYGHPLSPEEIKEGGHLTQLIREASEAGRTVGGYSHFPSFIHKLFPEEFQQCSFDVASYEVKDDTTITSKDRQRIKQQYEATWNHLRDLIMEAATRVYH